MKIHPYANLFPMCSDDEIQLLADDIAKNGLRQAIVIDADEMILDGRNRSVACKIAGVKPVYEPFPGTEAEKLAYVVSVNVHRRHLTTQQRADIAAKIATMSVGDNQHVATTKEGSSNEPPSKPVSTKQAAKLMNVSPSSVKRAKAAAKPAQSESSEVATDVATTASVPQKETKKKKPPTPIRKQELFFALEEVGRQLDKLRFREIHGSCVGVIPMRVISSLLGIYTKKFDGKKYEGFYDELRSTFDKCMPADLDKPSQASKADPIRFLYSLGECSYEYVHYIYRYQVVGQTGASVELGPYTYGETVENSGFTTEKSHSNVSTIYWREGSDKPSLYEVDNNGNYYAKELDTSRFQPRDGGGQYLYFEPGRVCYYDEDAINAMLKANAAANKKTGQEQPVSDCWAQSF